jgi:hypothetical protein
MRKTMLKTISVFTLVFFVMSMTGAAASSNSCKTKTDAINDSYSLNLKKCPNTSYCFKYNTVLKNDKGCNLKVTTTGTIKTALGGTVTMQSNGAFCYKAPAQCCSGKGTCTDSFKYCVKGTDGKTDCATVTMKLTCPACCNCANCANCASCANCANCANCASCANC